MPSYDRATKEITRRFAELGYDAIYPNLYWRDAPGAAPDDGAVHSAGHRRRAHRPLRAELLAAIQAALADAPVELTAP
jgi:dienelactone hydrolase